MHDESQKPAEKGGFDWLMILNLRVIGLILVVVLSVVARCGMHGT